MHLLIFGGLIEFAQGHSWNVFIHLLGGSCPTLRAKAFTDIILTSCLLSLYHPVYPCLFSGCAPSNESYRMARWKHTSS